jgi:hypothetical protein
MGDLVRSWRIVTYGGIGRWHRHGVGCGGVLEFASVNDGAQFRILCAKRCALGFEGRNAIILVQLRIHPEYYSTLVSWLFTEASVGEFGAF